MVIEPIFFYQVTVDIDSYPKIASQINRLDQYVVPGASLHGNILMFVEPLIGNAPLLEIKDELSIPIVNVEHNYLIAVISTFCVGVRQPKHTPLFSAVEGRNIEIEFDTVQFI